MDKQVKIALPKGRLLDETARLLEKACWGLGEYREGLRSYRLGCQRFPGLLVKVFHEKDIPIQVAVGNYDLGICGLDWVEELLAKYPSAALVKLRNLGYGDGGIHLVASRSGSISRVEEIQSREGVIRIASEYPNLAESLALELRLRRFSVFPVWGAAEVYPPESADLALVSGRKGEKTFDHDLVAVGSLLDFSACLIANRRSWETKDLGEILASFDGRPPAAEEPLSPLEMTRNPEITGERASRESDEDTVWLALPDGHQQQPTLELLSKAGIRVNDYPSQVGNRRPTSSLAGVSIKVIRPQDMPLQVANGNFDLAISGKDWLRDHLYQFPSSPVAELLDLKFGKVKIVAVISKGLPVADVYGLGQSYSEHSMPIRVASEYTNIADKYARDNHLGAYRVIPTWGASEAFLPEDADLLIENTQTGRTIARHNLKIIDTLFESTAYLIGHKDNILSQAKREKVNSIVRILKGAVGD